MSVELVTKFAPYTDEMFATESKASLLTNKDFDFDGAHTVNVYKITTAAMNNYGRSGPAQGNWSRYGPVQGLDAETEAFTLSKDRSFTFAIDRLDADETAGQLAAASALARQLRQVVIPEVDTYVLGKIIAGAGITPTAAALTAANIYDKIIAGTLALDNAEVPEVGRVLVLTAAIWALLKKSADVNTGDLATELKRKGVVGQLDGMDVLKVPAGRVPATFGFMIAHPVATVAPTKLESYKTHEDPPGISGSLVEGRIAYDAFVLENKAEAIYYHALPSS
jgi:hypothetical protein